MRFMSLLVALCFSMNVFASTGTIQELERQIDDYNYALSVDWDQKDAKVYEAKTNEFFAKLQKLIKEEGLTQTELMTVVENKMGNKEALAALKLKLSVLSSATTAEQLSQIIKDSSKDLYSRGASWNGDATGPVILGLLVAAVVGYAIWFSATHECVRSEPRYTCNSYNNCYGGYYGNGYYGGGYCNYSTVTCGYTDYCLEYAKK